jgi:hypothetical protein
VKLGGTVRRCGGGGGVAGARGTTLGEAATVCVDAGALGGGAVALSRCGGGGGAERSGAPGRAPRADGGGGMRDGKLPAPAGRGTTLTGRGATLTGAGSTEALLTVALGSFSSPIETRSDGGEAGALRL